MSLSGHRLLARVEVELARHVGTDNGKLPVTYDDFVRYGMHRHAIGPAIREATALGFIQVTEHGRAGNAEYRRPNLYKLTYRETAYDGPTHEWKRIETMEQAELIAVAARGTSIVQPWRSSRKKSSSGGERHVSAPETGTETSACPVPETATTVHSAEAATTSISRHGDAGAG